MTDPDSLGNPSEKIPARGGEVDQFASAVGPLSDGALAFPPPFDLIASAALATNSTKGQDAIRAHAVRRMMIRSSFRLQLHEIVQGFDERREIIDIQVDDLPLLAEILADLVENHFPD